MHGRHEVPRGLSSEQTKPSRRSQIRLQKKGHANASNALLCGFAARRKASVGSAAPKRPNAQTTGRVASHEGHSVLPGSNTTRTAQTNASWPANNRSRSVQCCCRLAAVIAIQPSGVGDNLTRIISPIMHTKMKTLLLGSPADA